MTVDSLLVFLIIVFLCLFLILLYVISQYLEYYEICIFKIIKKLLGIKRFPH